MSVPRQQLYLITPLVDDAASFAAELERALGAGDVAAVLLRLAQSGERSLIERVKTIGAAVQSRDIALVVDGHPEIVARAGADGAHLTGITAFAAALATLKPDRIAGAGGLRTRVLCRKQKRWKEQEQHHATGSHDRDYFQAIFGFVRSPFTAREGLLG